MIDPDTRQEIIDSMARTLSVTAWADQQEARGRSLSGELFSQAPKTSRAARTAARALAGSIERLNQRSLDELYVEAEAASGKHYEDATPGDFGYSLAMMSLGHGVSWWDNHPKFDLKVPHSEFYG